MELVGIAKPVLWRTLTTTRPYRRYYLYLAPTTEARFPQLLSIYGVMYLLGSLTRYRPVYLLNALSGTYGAFLSEFLATQPQQFVFGLACEFRQQEVSKAEVV